MTRLCPDASNDLPGVGDPSAPRPEPLLEPWKSREELLRNYNLCKTNAQGKLDQKSNSAAQEATDHLLHVFKDIPRDVVVVLTGEIILTIIALPETEGLSALALANIVEHAITVAALDFNLRMIWILGGFALKVVANTVIWAADLLKCRQDWYRDGGGQYGDPENQSLLRDRVEEKEQFEGGPKVLPAQPDRAEGTRWASRGCMDTRSEKGLVFEGLPLNFRSASA